MRCSLGGIRCLNIFVRVLMHIVYTMYIKYNGLKIKFNKFDY